jgi:hypothetical protein
VARQYKNFQAGTITNNPLASGGTSVTSAEFSTLPTITSTDPRMAIVLDPDAVGGAPEIVVVTAHTAASTTCTVVRAKEGTTARAHLSGTTWRHAATAQDMGTLTVFTPTLTASGVNPSGSLGRGHWTRMGSWFFAEVLITTTNAGTGSYTIGGFPSLTPMATIVGSPVLAQGSMDFNNGVESYPCQIVGSSFSGMSPQVLVDGVWTFVTATTPSTSTNGREIRLSFSCALAVASA